MPGLHPLPFLLACVTVALVLPSCWRYDPLYCDEQSDCADNPGRTFCDENGTYPASEGIGRTCIPDPGGTCTGPADCSDPLLPACVSGVCRACDATHACGPADPVCDQASSTCGDCRTDDDCAGFSDQKLCAADGACVGCRDDNDCAAEGSACDDATHQCTGCTTDSDCESGICDEARSACIPSANILHVDEASTTPGPDCTRATPCTTLAEAHARVLNDRRYILVEAGTYDGGSLKDRDFVLVGYRAVIEGSLEISGDVVLEGVEIRRGRLDIAKPGAAVLDHVRVTLNLETNYNAIMINNDATTIRDSIIENNPGLAILVDSGTTTISNTAIRNNLFYGVYVNPFTETTVIDGCTITDNGGSGIYLSGKGYRVTNNFIAGNGNPGSNSAGIEVQQTSSTPTPPSPAQIEHNTIVNNEGPSGSSVGASGIRCISTSNPVFKNNIVHGNQTNASNSGQVSGPCAHNYSLIGPGTPPSGQGNISAEPLFVDVAARNFHLLPASPARDSADPVRDRSAPFVTVGKDIDGDDRPQGARADIGADEAR